MPQSRLPKWLMKRYSLLWQAFGKAEFGHSESCRVLRGDGKDFVSEVLSGLKKASWLEVRINPQDSRKRVYRLISPEEAVKKSTLRVRLWIFGFQIALPVSSSSTASVLYPFELVSLIALPPYSRSKNPGSPVYSDSERVKLPESRTNHAAIARTLESFRSLPEPPQHLFS